MTTWSPFLGVIFEWQTAAAAAAASPRFFMGKKIPPKSPLGIPDLGETIGLIVK